MKARFALLFFTGMLFASMAKAQKLKPSDFGIKSKKALDFYVQAQQNDQWRDYFTAATLYLKATELEPAFGQAWYGAANDYYNLKKYKEGLPCIEKAYQTWKNPQPMISYFAAELNFYNANYDRAARFYQEFIQSGAPVHKTFVEKAKLNLRHANFAAKEKLRTVKFELKNLGDGVNSMGEEIHPSLTADEQTIFFTTRRPGCIGDYIAELRGYGEDFYFSQKKTDGSWGPAVNLGPPVNTELNEGAATFSPDGQYVYFTGCNRKNGYGNCDLFESRLDGDKWLEPRNLGPLVNTEFWESQPCLSSDGNTIYFVSSRPGGLGAEDLWYTRRVGGKWQKAMNLGAPVNTPGNEYSPFIHADGRTLYFSSDYHPGFGGLDLFLSRKKGETWTEPENLGYPINTSSVEQTIFINSDGTKGYISSEREGGLGGWDIYEFMLDDRIKPFLATFVRGIVRDSATRKPIEATITFIELETRDTMRIVTANRLSGKYLLNLPMERDYAAFVDAKGYLFESQNFSLKDLGPKQGLYFDLDLFLSPIREGASMILKNIFYETAKFNLLSSSQAELEHIVNFMKQNPRVKIEISGHTDDIGTDEENRVLSQSRAGEVRNYLITKGVLPDRIVSKGYGETKPVAANDTEENRARNRRTEFRILGM